jgi:hypothetical protein
MHPRNLSASNPGRIAVAQMALEAVTASLRKAVESGNLQEAKQYSADAVALEEEIKALTASPAEETSPLDPKTGRIFVKG